MRVNGSALQEDLTTSQWLNGLMGDPLVTAAESIEMLSIFPAHGTRSARQGLKILDMHARLRITKVM